MEMILKKSSVEEWARQCQNMYSVQVPVEQYIRANLFSSIQFLPDEITGNNSISAYSVEVSGQDVGWAAMSYLAPEVLRIRSTYVLPEFRRKGVMSYLFQQIIEMNKNAKKIIIFSKKSATGFYGRFNFQIDKTFIPRRPWFYDQQTNKYVYQDDEELFVMVYRP